MRNFFYLKKSNFIFFSLAVFLLGLRILLGRAVGICLPVFLYHDDALMIRYADFHEHFVSQNLPWIDLLVKDMGFPVFLNVINFLGIRYTDALALLSLISAIFFIALFVMLTEIKRKEILMLIYVFVLFYPVAFTWIGIRFYRNSALIMFYFILLTMMVILFAWYWGKIKVNLKKLFFFNAMLGIFFTWTYYFKEDGIWLLMCLTAIIILCFAKVIFEKYSLKIKLCHLVILLIPIFIFMAGTVAYKQINFHFFGVYLINNRTEGELGRFVKIVYKIKSEERNSKIWAPTDAILQAFQASPTLRKNENLKENILHTQWFGKNIYKNPIHGDFLGWVTLTALKDSNTCSSLVEQENYLRKVNDELENAFDNGILQKDDRFQIISSMGGRTLKEFFNLRKKIGKTYRTFVTLRYEGYIKEHLVMEKRLLYSLDDMSYVDKEKPEYQSLIKKASEFIGIDMYVDNVYAEKVAPVIKILSRVYGIINSIYFILAFVGLFYFAKNFLRNRENISALQWLNVSVIVGAFSLSFVYTVALAWFDEFLGNEPVAYYGIGLIAMIMIFEIFGTYLFYTFWKNK